MKSLRKSFVVASLCLLTASAGYAQQDAKDAKEIPVQQAPKPASPDEWQFSFTPYTWLPTVDLNFRLPTVTVGNRTIGGNISVTSRGGIRWASLADNFYVLSVGWPRSRRGKGAGADSSMAIGSSAKTQVSGSDSRLIFRDRVDITASSTVTDRFGTGQINFGPQFVLGTAPLSRDFQCLVRPLWRRPGQLVDQR